MNEFYLDDGSYDELFNLLNNQYFVEKVGYQIDMEFFFDDWWLRDIVVIENVVK